MTRNRVTWRLPQSTMKENKREKKKKEEEIGWAGVAVRSPFPLQMTTPLCHYQWPPSSSSLLFSFSLSHCSRSSRNDMLCSLLPHKCKMGKFPVPNEYCILSLLKVKRTKGKWLSNYYISSLLFFKAVPFAIFCVYALLVFQFFFKPHGFGIVGICVGVIGP